MRQKKCPLKCPCICHDTRGSGHAHEGHSCREQQEAERAYPDHSPSAAWANYTAGREVWDTNGDVW